MIETWTENRSTFFTFRGHTPRVNDFLSEIKSKIPVRTGWAYFEEKQRWWISEQYTETFRRIYERYFSKSKQMSLL